MARFLSQLIVERADEFDDGLWRLVSALMYESDVLKTTITVPSGFITDFASVPRIPIVYELCGGTSCEASVVHDYLYTTRQFERSLADATLREASAVSHVPKWRREIMWAGVRLFGWTHWKQRKAEKGIVSSN